MAPRNCLQLLTRVLNQFDTTEQQDQEQWENLLTTLKSNKLTLTETPVDYESPSRSTGKTEPLFWDLKDVKITSESNDLVYGTCKMTRRVREAVEEDDESEEVAEIHLENIQITKHKRHGFRARMVIVTPNRTIQVESKRCSKKISLTCYDTQLIGTSIETKSSAKVSQDNSKQLYSANLQICGCRDTTGCC